MHEAPEAADNVVDPQDAAADAAADAAIEAAVDADETGLGPGDRPRTAQYHAVIFDKASRKHTIMTRRYKQQMLEALNGIGEERIIATFYGRLHETSKRTVF